MSRTTQVLISQGDPIFGFGAIARVVGGGLKRAVGGLFKRGASKVVQVARTPAVQKIGRAAGAVAGGAAAVAIGERIAGRGVTGIGAPGGMRAIIDPQTGQIIGFRRARRRGISATELRGFRKVTNLLARVGMTPRGLGRRRRKVC